MELLQSISLDFGKDTEPIIVFAKQGDVKSRYIEITPLDKGKRYIPESGITARLHITKPDEKIVLSDASIETSTGIIKAELPKQALTAAGMAVAEIGLYKGDSLLTSQLFGIRIVKKAYADDAVVSSDDYKSLLDALSKVDSAVKLATDAANEANTQAGKVQSKIGEADAAIAKTKSAADSANTAAAGANSAASSASQAAESANSAAKSASDSAAKATSSSQKADTSATNADKKAQLADEKAALADTAAGKADAAADKAEKWGNVSVTAKDLAPGSEPTVNLTDTPDGKALEFGIPRGENGLVNGVRVNGTLAEPDAENVVDVKAYNEDNKPEVGGRNLISGTSGEWIDFNPPGGWQYRYLIDYEKEGIKIGDKVTIQCEIECDAESPYNMVLMWGSDTIESIYAGERKYIKATVSISALIDDPIIIGGVNIGTKGKFRKLKAERGEIPTDWSPAPEDLENEIDKKIDDIQIGGRNLLTGTKELADNQYVTDEKYLGFAVLHSDRTSSETGYDNLLDNEINQIIHNQKYSFSFYAKGTGQAWAFLYSASPDHVNVKSGYTSQGEKSNKIDGAIPFYISNEWQKYWVVYEFASSGDENIPIHLLLRVVPGNELYACAPKFEFGEIATDWSPAPEDLMPAQTTIFDLCPDGIMHRNLFRGKYLGEHVTSEQVTAINNGSFKDLFIGDYWTINDVNWLIADMNFFYLTGDVLFRKNHLVIIPQSVLYMSNMNSSNTTEGGYVGSDMYKTGLDIAKEKIKAAFPNMVLSHRDILINQVTDGHPSEAIWTDSEVELMTEVMVYGTYHHAVMNPGSYLPVKYTTARQQFAIFALNPYYDRLDVNFLYWLRDVVSATTFAVHNYLGYTFYGFASDSHGVRPYFCIGSNDPDADMPVEGPEIMDDYAEERYRAEMAEREAEERRKAELEAESAGDESIEAPEQESSSDLEPDPDPGQAQPEPEDFAEPGSGADDPENTENPDEKEGAE